MTLVAKNESKAKLLNEKCMHDFLILFFSFSLTSFGILTHFARIDEYFRMQNTSKLVRESFCMCVCVCVGIVSCSWVSVRKLTAQRRNKWQIVFAHPHTHTHMCVTWDTLIATEN